MHAYVHAAKWLHHFFFFFPIGQHLGMGESLSCVCPYIGHLMIYLDIQTANEHFIFRSCRVWWHINNSAFHYANIWHKKVWAESRGWDCALCCEYVCVCVCVRMCVRQQTVFGWWNHSVSQTCPPEIPSGNVCALPRCLRWDARRPLSHFPFPAQQTAIKPHSQNYTHAANCFSNQNRPWYFECGV